mmetsp:Transcript_4078/g.6002  ORF Transcript_4078/g.6002 Transcript_4078/m.6002 type:complete len:203 (-) Transcript_4078:3991-4599(-)
MAGSGEAINSFRLLLIGETAVGKTSLMMQYADETFPQIFVTTVGIDFKRKTLDIDGKEITLEIWDTAGQERFQSITTAYLRGAHAIMVCYDVTNRDSFEKVENWIHKIDSYSNVDVDKVLVGNKCDLENDRVISTSEGQELACKFGMGFFETSAKENMNVAHAFEHVAKLVSDRLDHSSKEAEKVKLDDTQEDNASAKNGCC